MARFLQANLNRSRPAQDLALQYCVEEEVGVSVFSELHTVPNRPHWAGSTDSLCAVHWRPCSCPNLCRLIGAGKGFVAIKIGKWVVFSCYFSPNRDLAEFERYLDSLGVAVRPHLPGAVIVAGDFNAKYPEWGSVRWDRRGRLLASWADSINLAPLTFSRRTAPFGAQL
ncbi:uncharacterized protein LOC109860997 [Pseudomyrmex gracilis]|uniref:uncharacterized protein LOC109860997 n=1 Tax=Pseudomyrmex gracilis TaxID=219809 RepID=UPI000994B22A|nr:uncharacterized protein LOC109860997 [Pseudomyrmex gracilis]